MRSRRKFFPLAVMLFAVIGVQTGRAVQVMLFARSGTKARRAMLQRPPANNNGDDDNGNDNDKEGIAVASICRRGERRTKARSNKMSAGNFTEKASQLSCHRFLKRVRPCPCSTLAPPWRVKGMLS